MANGKKISNEVLQCMSNAAENMECMGGHVETVPYTSEVHM